MYQEQRKWAGRLQNALGTDFMVHFDVLDGGFTNVYYKGILFTSVPNEKMTHDLNVFDYIPSMEWKMVHGVY